VENGSGKCGKWVSLICAIFFYNLPCRTTDCRSFHQIIPLRSPFNPVFANGQTRRERREAQRKAAKLAYKTSKALETEIGFVSQNHSVTADIASSAPHTLSTTGPAGFDSLPHAIRGAGVGKEYFR